MRKIMGILCLAVGLMFIVGCSKTVYIESRPVGYARVANDFVAKGSFIYDSQKQYNLNEVSLVLYVLPHVWGEIKNAQAQTLSLDDPDFIVFDEVISSVMTRRAFTKHVMIDNQVWTASQVETGIVYKNSEGTSFREQMSDPMNIRRYIEEMDCGQTYFLDHEYVMLFGYESKYDDGDFPFIHGQPKIVMINYVETLDAMPDLSVHFPEYDAQDLATLFSRIYDLRNEAEFKVAEYTK